MKGWLVVNEFVKTEKFLDLFRLLSDAASAQNCELLKKTNAQVWTLLGERDYDLSEVLKDIDFILFWDKDIRLAHALEAQGIRVYNSAQAIADCDDKSLTYLKLAGRVRQPKSFISPKKFHADGLYSEEMVQAIGENLGYPCVIKECLGSFGQQVYLVQNEEELIEKITMIGDRAWIAQEFISASKGNDTRIQVVGGRVAAAMRRYNPNDFRANLTNGGSMEPYTPSKAEEEMALKVCEILNLDFAGVDILFGEDGPVLCEVNSNAHFRNLYDGTGINAADHIIRHILDTCKR